MFGGLAQILIWGSEIAKGGTWSLGIKGGPKFRGAPKILEGPMNPNDVMIYIYIYIYIYLHVHICTYIHI